MDNLVDQGPSSDELLAVRLRQQELIAAFGVFALRSNDIEGVLHQACEVAARGLETQFAKLLELQPDGRGLLVRNGVGWRDGVVGRVVMEADHFHRTQLFHTPTLMAEHGIRSAINVVVEAGCAASTPFGVLAVDSSDRDRFSAADTAFMQSLAEMLSAAIVRQQREAAQEHLLQEKDTVIQEVHHRVKNNLQLIQTMLTLQARSLADGTERSGLRSAAGRIMSIAAVHRRLYETGAATLVDVGPYLSGLVDDLVGSFGGADEARPITLDAEAMRLPPEHVTSAGLIVVELVTNAVKYGAGAIAVRLFRTAEGVEIMVEDGGEGIPTGIGPAFSGSLGLRLVAALARTPDAIAISRHDSGARVTVQVAFGSPLRQLAPSAPGPALDVD